MCFNKISIFFCLFSSRTRVSCLANIRKERTCHPWSWWHPPWCYSHCWKSSTRCREKCDQLECWGVYWDTGGSNQRCREKNERGQTRWANVRHAKTLHQNFVILSFFFHHINFFTWNIACTWHCCQWNRIIHISFQNIYTCHWLSLDEPF